MGFPEQDFTSRDESLRIKMLHSQASVITLNDN